MKCENRYGDMLSLPYPFVLIRPRMSLQDRAAQFAPFAALNGHEAAIRESGRLAQAQAEWEGDQVAAFD